MERVLLSPLHKWRNWGSGRFGNFPQIIKPGSWGLEFKPRSNFQSPSLTHSKTNESQGPSFPAPQLTWGLFGAGRAHQAEDKADGREAAGLHDARSHTFWAGAGRQDLLPAAEGEGAVFPWLEGSLLLFITWKRKHPGQGVWSQRNWTPYLEAVSPALEGILRAIEQVP